eukprot:Clim_evm30s236 gene=Clim_evmTU30s236
MSKKVLRSVKNTYKGYSQIEQLVREATSNDPTGAKGTYLAQIANATYNHLEYPKIMNILYKRLNDSGKNWRHVYKSLVLYDYLIKNGASRVVDEAKSNQYVIRTLHDFQYVDPVNGKDVGFNVRERAKQLTALLNDDERLKEERQRADRTRERMRSAGQEGYGFGSDAVLGDGGQLAHSHRGHTSRGPYVPDGRTARRTNPDEPSNAYEEQAQLERALELSRHEDGSAPPAPATRASLGDPNLSEEEQLRRAIEISKQEAQAQGIRTSGAVPAGAPAQQQPAGMGDLLDLEPPNGWGEEAGDKDPFGGNAFGGPSSSNQQSNDPFGGSAWGGQQQPQQQQQQQQNAFNNDPWGGSSVSQQPMQQQQQQPMQQNNIYGNQSAFGNDVWGGQQSQTMQQPASNGGAAFGGSHVPPGVSGANQQLGDILTGGQASMNNGNNAGGASSGGDIWGGEGDVWGGASTGGKKPEEEKKKDIWSSDLVNLDTLSTSGPTTGVTGGYNSVNPFKGGQSMGMNMGTGGTWAGMQGKPANNPFQQQKQAGPTINELRGQQDMTGTTLPPSLIPDSSKQVAPQTFGGYGQPQMGGYGGMPQQQQQPGQYGNVPAFQQPQQSMSGYGQPQQTMGGYGQQQGGFNPFAQ